MFFLKKGSGLPLHDHEDMAVFTRVLSGNIKYRAMDKVVLKADMETNSLDTFMYY